MKLWYTSPAGEWAEALPIGNGSLGAMVFGNPEAERIQLNLDTLWSGRPREWNNPIAVDMLSEIRQALFVNNDVKGASALASEMQGPPVASYQPPGELHVDFRLPEDPVDYHRELNLRDALTTTRFRSGNVTHTREVFASYPDGVIVMHLDADQPGSISLTAWLDSLLEHSISFNSPDTLTLSGRASEHVNPTGGDSGNPIGPGNGMAFQISVAARVSGGIMTVDQSGLNIEGADSVELIIAGASGFSRFDAKIETHHDFTNRIVRETLTSALLRSYESLNATHIHDHRDLWERNVITLGTPNADALPTDELIRQDPPDHATLFPLLYQYGRYLLIASSRPGCQAANDRGIWSEDIRPPGGSAYDLSFPTQMRYWPAEVTSLPECHMPLLELILDLSDTGQKTAHVNYGADGWVSHRQTDLWRQSAPEGGFGDGRPEDCAWPMSGIWLSRHLWEHYQFSTNVDFLRHFAWPVMESAAAFLEDWLIPNEDSYLVTAPSVSPRNRFRLETGDLASISSGSTMDLSLAWDHLTNCIAAGSLLNIDSRRLSGFERIRKRLPPPRVSPNGRIQEWIQDRDIPADQPRALSPLFGLHPGRQITSDLSPRLCSGARATLEHAARNTREDSSWSALMWARLGDGNEALKALQQLSGPADGSYADGLMPNLMFSDGTFRMHGSCAFTAAMAEMMLQSHDGELHLCPAIPDAWPAGHVRGLSARGGFRVDVHWEKGAMTHCIIYTAGTRLCRVRHREGGTEFEAVIGRCYLITSQFDVIEA